MTLSELLPSLGCEAADHLEPGVWPRSTRLGSGGELLFAGAPVSHLAARFGTPAYLLDEDEVRQNARAYRRALPDAEVAYASKALCTRAVLRWVAEEGLSLDTCSAGEIAVARSVGFPAERILLHGNAKTPEDLKAALSYGVRRIVVDSLDEIEQLGALATGAQQVLIRVTPTSRPARTRRSPPAPKGRSSASRCVKRFATTSAGPSPPYSRSRGSAWPGCTATSVRRCPVWTSTSRPPGR